MKIVITTVQIPFVKGGAEFLAENLKNALIQAKHEVEIVTIPFADNPPSRIEDYIVGARLMDITQSWGGYHDLCIALKFPAYYMPHPNKVVWALHQHRGAYDLFDTEYSGLKADEQGLKMRDIIYNADRTYLNEAKAIYTISDNVTKRMADYTGIDASTLYHPCPDMDSFYHEEYGDYILMPSRINITKRQKLAIEALSKTKEPVKLMLVGKADNPIEMENIKKLIKEHHLEERVICKDFVPQEEKLKLYANAKAVLFIPLDEDYGYITLEAMAASKAVITMRDSGGPLEFIEDGISGIVSENNAEELARHLDEMWRSTQLAKEMGQRGKRILTERDITWEHVVEVLTRS